jgi:threonine/homoserine/homoserine lactone efflux protein
MGYITNVTNPKATLFILSLFTLVISPATPLFVKVIMGLEMSSVTAAWFIVVTFLVSHRAVKKRFTRFQHRFEQAMGVALVVLGLVAGFAH